jgi:hypothetical protein
MGIHVDCSRLDCSRPPCADDAERIVLDHIGQRLSCCGWQISYTARNCIAVRTASDYVVSLIFLNRSQLVIAPKWHRGVIEMHLSDTNVFEQVFYQFEVHKNEYKDL